MRRALPLPPTSAMPAFVHVSALLLALFAAACSGGGSDKELAPDAGLLGGDAGQEADAGPTDSESDPSDALFEPNHILEVSISLNPSDWATLRSQVNAIDTPKVTCASQPTERAYDYFAAEVTIDGLTTSNVGIRKKGSLGSGSTTRPGLKIKASEFVQGQRIFGTKMITLNNNRQDESYISQCLGYGLFQNAGIPSSRCSFAHVTVNGEDLGIYSNVESIKKSMIKRHFADDSGHIYESGGDFRVQSIDEFQPKEDAVPPDCSDLAPIATALDAPPDQLLSQLGEVVDMDSFMTYWAMEVIMDHWDGYANNRNNFYFYHDPTSNKMHMIPWGIDALFEGRERSTRPKSVFACGRMAWKLYDAPQTQAMYLSKLEQLLGSVWDEGSILSEINRMETLLAPYVDPQHTGSFAANVQGVRDFVSSRRGDLLAEVQAGPPEWPYAEDESCLISLGTVSGSFDTSWDTLDNFAAGTGTMSGVVAGTDLSSTTGFTSAGINPDNQGLVQVFVQLPDASYAVVLLVIRDLANVQPGTLNIDLVNVFAMMTFYDPATDSAHGGGLMLRGNVSFTSASTVPGAPIVGTFTGEVVEI